MKFFTTELFADLNSQDEDVVDRAEEKWEAAIKGYREHFRKIEEKLPRSLVQFSKNVSLHDSRVMSTPNPVVTLVATDDTGTRNSAIISVMHEHAEFYLIYQDLVEPSRVTHSVDCPRFDQRNVLWLYDEVGLAKSGVFSHEILLSNGDVIHVEFRGFRYTQRLIVGPRAAVEMEAAGQPGLSTA
jgi:hypothetical protein